MRSELEADVTEMMKRVHLGVNSRFSPEAILIFRKIARGWGGISESPPSVRNEPTGTAGPLPQWVLVAPSRSGAACRVIMARTWATVAFEAAGPQEEERAR